MNYSNSIQNLPQAINTNTTSLKPVVNTVDVASADHASKTSGASAGSDQASLSLASTLLASALKGSDVRTDKVAALQQAIGTGSYNVSSSDVADKLLQTLQG